MTDFDDAARLKLLAFLDQFAQQCIAQNGLLRFAVAQTESEHKAAYRLRYHEVVTRGWGSPADFPDGMERDKYDDAAVQILVMDGENLAATARLVFPASGRLLPVEESFDLVIQPQNQVVYLSRVVIAPDYRGQAGHVLLMGVLSKGWQEIRARGFEQLCGVFSESVMPLFRRVGIVMVPLCPPREFWGEMRHACTIDMLRTAQTLLSLPGEDIEAT